MVTNSSDGPLRHVSQQLGRAALELAAGNDKLGGEQGLKLPDPESPRIVIDYLVGEELEMTTAEDENLPVLEVDAPLSVETSRESRLKGQEVL